METAFRLQTNPSQCLTIINHPSVSLLIFHDRVWQYFHRWQIIERMQAWNAAATGPSFRLPIGWNEVAGSLHVQLPPLPEGYLPFSEIPRLGLDQRTLLRLLLTVCEALAHLHRRHFHMGFLLPDHLYFHPETLAVLLDIQPFPSAFPFVRHALRDYPFELLSRHARVYNMPRIADFSALGLLTRSIWNGQNGEHGREMPASLEQLCERLVNRPESFLFAEEIGSLLRSELFLPVLHDTKPVETKTEWLHPMAPPILPEQQEQLRAFLRPVDGPRLIGLICEDVATRLDVYNQHLNEVIENDYFFTIGCKNLPFATLRELIDRTMGEASRFFPEGTSRLPKLARKLKRIFQQHYVGEDILHELTEWLFQFLLELKPMLQWQSFYYIFEGCEHFDEDSQRVFIRFWRKYSGELTGLHAIFSGKQLPSMMAEAEIRLIDIGRKDRAMYRRLLLSQLGRAESGLLSRLVEWFTENQIEFGHCRIMLEKLIETGRILLTPQGWSMSETFSLDAEELSPVKLLAERIALLSAAELDTLRTLACLPLPIRAADMYRANGLDVGDLAAALSRFSRLGILQVYQSNSVYVPIDVARLALYELPAGQQRACFQKALPLQQQYRPDSLPPLIELSMLADNKRSEYFYLIKYYRHIRHLLSLERKKAMLRSIKQLQTALGHSRILCWDRLLCQVYIKLNQYDAAEKLAKSLYQRTGAAVDRFALKRILLFTNRIDLSSLKRELIESVTNRENSLSDRAHAAHLLAYVNFFTPLHLEVARVVDMFYREEVFPNRKQLSNRLFAELSIIYTTLLYQYFPERDEWTSALRKKIESILEQSSYRDLMIDLFNSYFFHNNVRIAHTYNQRQLEMSKRYGFTAKLQISHLNGAESSLHLGDLTAYRYHMEKVRAVDEIKRVDLLEQYLIHQLLYACEWRRWDLFQQAEAEILQKDVGDLGFFYWEIFSRYATFRQKSPLPPPTVWEKEEEHTLFIDALYQIEAGHYTEAYQLFQKSLSRNGDRMLAGWVYREMISLLLDTGSEETQYWLEQFKQYLKAFSCDLFWPDYYRASAAWALQKGNLLRAMLYLRRAANGYQLIEKEDEYKEVTGELNRVVQPSVLPAGSPLLGEPFVQALMAEREHFLHQSLDLQVIIQLSEQVTETLELTHTIHRLTHALFEYFPVTHLSVSFNLFYLKGKKHYSVSGLMEDEELLQFQSRQENEAKYAFHLYRQDNQQITLEVYSQTLTDTQRQHMEHFLSFIKPHIANVLLYMEMMIDNLTGFYQRRYFMKRLEEEFALSKRYGLDLSLIMLDIDNFRSVNEHGHQEGDKVLRELAEIIRGVLRKNDIPGRYGGEEMLLILPKTDGQAALQIARELRKQIEEEFAAGHPYRVTVSVGVSSLELCQSETVDELIRAADDAEIIAKTTGKNRVIAAWGQDRRTQPT
jgi:diguanylate cyclase (GGDEF)-like protein